MFPGKALADMMPEASATNVPFSPLPPPSSLATGLSGLMGLMHFSLAPKKAVTSITTFFPL